VLTYFFFSQDRQIAALLSLVERYCQQHGLVTHVEFLPDHPVEEVGRLLLSVLIKHLGLSSHVLRVIDRGKSQTSLDEMGKDLNVFLHRSERELYLISVSFAMLTGWCVQSIVSLF
jgi:radical SAM superfamily enzyme YgiQ (UPF0313 family)